MTADGVPDSQPLYLEDLVPGQRWVSGTCKVEEAAIRAFAEQFDPQPFHLDPAAARSTFFEGLAASGWHTAALTMRLLVTGGLRLAGGLIGTGGTLSWPKPTRPGDVLRVESEVVEVRPSRSRPDRGMGTFRCSTLNERNEVVQVFTGNLLVWRRKTP
jgi:acyl dehydratase